MRPCQASGAWEQLLLQATLCGAECLSQCVVQRLGHSGSMRLRMGLLWDTFRCRQESYNYLQRAYYQLKKLDLAAAIAHTFFVANPTQFRMQKDMLKYRYMPRVQPWSFQDLEKSPYWAAYDSGLELLEHQEAGLALPRLEKALQESLSQMESCWADCEGLRSSKGRKKRRKEQLLGDVATDL